MKYLLIYNVDAYKVIRLAYNNSLMLSISKNDEPKVSMFLICNFLLLFGLANLNEIIHVKCSEEYLAHSSKHEFLIIAALHTSSLFCSKYFTNIHLQEL